ncbi:MAG TPA: hypothetical protein VLD67_00435 [Vicinamibacterales bacterium]|nr:hypothetical protein [Vicinamibacterales bacterium]
MPPVLHYSRLLLAIAIVAGCPGFAAAQDAQGLRTDEIAELRAELASLRAELEALKQLVAEHTLAASRDQPPGAGQPPPADPRLEILQTQVAQLAQVKVESTTRFPLRVFGTIHMHAFANTGEANWMDVPNLVQPRPADGQTGTFSATVRQSRFGFAADGPRIGSARSSAVLAMDFFGGIPGFQTGQVMGLPRLLVGFARVETDRLAFQAGQDHVILAPRDPSSLAAFAFPLLFRSGNLYLRAPQARVEAAVSERVRLTAGVLAPIAGDVPGEDYRFVPPALGGERSRRPAVQAHLGYASDTADARRRVALGMSGHFGWERRGRLDESWAGAIDFAARHEVVGVAGELFTGRNIDAYGGGIGLSARSSGGWAELQLFPSDRLAGSAGVGMDRLRGDVSALPRRRARSAYGNIRFALTPELEAGFEYQWLSTLPGMGAERSNHHLDWVMVFRF